MLKISCNDFQTRYNDLFSIEWCKIEVPKSRYNEFKRHYDEREISMSNVVC